MGDAYECESNILQRNPQLWCIVGNKLAICLIMGLYLIEILFLPRFTKISFGLKMMLQKSILKAKLKKMQLESEQPWIQKQPEKVATGAK